MEKRTLFSVNIHLQSCSLIHNFYSDANAVLCSRSEKLTVSCGLPLISHQIARNRLGLNDQAHELAKQAAAKEKAEKEAEAKKQKKKGAK